jgi:transcription initiation factor TFIID TATA-box-binding protein
MLVEINMNKAMDVQLEKYITNFRIVNIVANTSVGIKLNLNFLNDSLDNVEYDPELYYALIYRIQNTKISILVNFSGKIIFVGAKSLDDIELAYSHFKKNLKLLGIEIKTGKIYIQNIVATFSFLFHVNLNDLIKILNPNQVVYLPEQFPGLIYKIRKNENEKVNILIFNKGKCVIVGVKRIEDFQEIIKLFLKEIHQLTNF